MRRGADETRADKQPGAQRGGSRDTPAMRQFARFKAAHPGCVLLFRMGDFYELFDDDAVEIARALGLTLTERTPGVPMAGVPHHAVDGYLRRMIDLGYRVAVCDQVQDPKDAKGVVDRAVTRVVTPGTLVDEPLMEEGAVNQVAAIAFDDDGRALLAVAELSTGRFTVAAMPAVQAVDELVRLQVSELLFAEQDDGTTPPAIDRYREAAACVVTARPAWSFLPAEAHDLLIEHYGVRSMQGFGFQEGDPLIRPAGALLRYLQETQAPAERDRRERLGHLRPPRRRDGSGYLTIDATSLRSLELERTMRTGQTAGSLLASLQRCRTPMGKRLLRQWLCFPLRDIERIERRQEAVAAILADMTFEQELRELLGRIQDVARIAARVAMGRATPRDIVALGGSVELLETIRTMLDGRPAFAATVVRLQAVAGELTPLSASIRAGCVESPPAHLREGGLFRDGVDAELDEARGLQRDANAWLASYQKQLVDDTGIGSLKVGFNKVFGYYIEVTHTHAEKVPPAFSRKQTLKNAERYVTPDLKDFEDRVTTAEARAIDREKHLFEQLCVRTAEHGAALAAFAEIVARLDVLRCFAEIAREHGHTRPTLVDAPVLEIRQGRHPVLESSLGERFVPNDCSLGAGDGMSLALITGPNMAGKSTYIRQNAIIVLLAHTGGFVPAESATIGLADRIFTRIGASDELHLGQSTFMVEMTETANILHHATERSVVILDEIGRGTSTLDGLSLAWAIAETLAEVGCRTLFATHYHELTTLAERLPRVGNLQVAVREWGDEIIFLYRIVAGRTDRSYGIHVAKIAGLPESTVQRAQQVLETLAVQTESSPIAVDAGGGEAQMQLFTEYVDHPALRELESLDLEGMSPMEAFDAMRTLQRRLREPEGSG